MPSLETFVLLRLLLSSTMRSCSPPSVRHTHKYTRTHRHRFVCGRAWCWSAWRPTGDVAAVASFFYLLPPLVQTPPPFFFFSFLPPAVCVSLSLSLSLLIGCPIPHSFCKHTHLFGRALCAFFSLHSNLSRLPICVFFYLRQPKSLSDHFRSSSFPFLLFHLFPIILILHASTGNQGESLPYDGLFCCSPFP